MSTSLRILVVTVVHDPEDARIRHRQIPALQQAGHDVTYAAPFAAYGRRPPEGVRGLDLPRAQGRRRLGAVLAARRLIARSADRADVVLIHDPDLLLAVAGLRRRIGTVVWDVHEDTAAALSMRGWVPHPLRGVLAAVMRGAERLAESRYHLLLAEAGYQRRFRRLHPVVPNTVRVPTQPPSAPGDDRVVYLGRLTAARGGAELIELARQVPEVTLEVLGPADADIEPQIRTAHEQGVLTWHGFVANDVALRTLDGALAGVSLLHDEPNYAHSAPTKLMEYIAHGLPVITTPNPASAALAETVGGAVVPFGDVEQAGRVLREWIDDPDLRRRIGASGYDYARHHLDWTTGGVEFARALERLAAR